MDSSKDLPNQNASDQLRSATEDMPSLDVLSFEHELCTSLNCQCRREQNRRNANVSSGLSPFSFRTELHPSLKRPLAGSSGCATGNSNVANERFARMTMPPVFGAPVYAGSLTSCCGLNERPLEDARSVLGNTGGSLFGAEHCGRANFHSFAQLNTQGSNLDAGTSQPSSGTFHALQIPTLSPRSPAESQLPARVSNGLDLSDLQTVLEDSVEELPADVASCPAHLLQSSPGLIRPCTCAQQAAKFDDWTVDELAGYFDDFCHIPKKMSAMAEMMYM